MALIKTDGTAPNKDTTIDGKFKRVIIPEGGYVPSSCSDTNGEVGELSFTTTHGHYKVDETTWGRWALTTTGW